MERITLKHVAKNCGFSVTTVSRVLSGTDYPVSDEARKAITQTAKKLGYVPNVLARSLKTNISQEVAVILPSITNPFYTSMTMGIESVLSNAGYNMLVYLTGGDPARDCEMLNSLRGKMVAGVIIPADCITPEVAQILDNLKKDSIPFVTIDYIPDASSSDIGVFFDYRRGGQLAARYLLDQGHRKIAFATLRLDRYSRRSRRKGFCEAVKAAGVPFSSKDVFESNEKDEFEAGIGLARNVLDSNRSYTAIASNNDAVAMGILSELASRGLRVPDDISVIGFDDCIFSRMSTPLLTTVQVPAEKMGKLAAQFMLGELTGEHFQYSIYLEPRIIERQSVRNIKMEGESVV